MNTRDRRRCSRGFTLIELMVTMVITAIIVGVLISITSLAMDAWQQSRSEVRCARQAKSMLDAMAKDMESFVFRPGNSYEWLYAKTSTPLPTTTTGMASTSASDLIFFSAATDRYNGQIGTSTDKGGDISCVAYKLVYQDPIKGNSGTLPTFAFYRELENPDVTFANLLGQANLYTAFSSYQANLISVQNFVCENIYQFDVTFHVNVTNSSGVAQTYPVSVLLGPQGTTSELHIKGNAVASSSSGTAMSLGGGTVTGVSAISISVTVLSDFAIEQMRTRTFANTTAKAAFIAKYGFHYVKNVKLPGN